MDDGKQWSKLRSGFVGKSTPQALKDFGKTRIWKDIEQFLHVNLEVFREMLELDPDQRQELYDTKRSDAHVRGMIEVTKGLTFLLDDMVEIVLQQRQEEKDNARQEDND
tara:strand:+ start:172 stop:498 length:327 start_codon:yes stop_codon:yes gene_type:complete